MDEPTTALRSFPDRWQSAGAKLPFGDEANAFFTHAVNEADIFAMTTARDGKGGPFGAALWIVSATQGPANKQPVVKFVFVGPSLSSNAVLSTGIGSNHAEAVDLEVSRRRTALRFLRRLRRQRLSRDQNSKGQVKTMTAVVQVSSAESCSSCRAKQCIFAENLYALDLLDRGQFYVAFKASYERTSLDAGFHDKPYDLAYRILLKSGVLDSPEYLCGVANNRDCRAMLRNEKALAVPVHIGDAAAIPATVSAALLKLSDDKRRPAAVVVAAAEDDAHGGAGAVTILGAAVDQRRSHALRSDHPAEAGDSEGVAAGMGLNEYEQSAITLALHRASRKRRADGVFESWNLDRATVYTNLHEIGPLAYSEALWANIGRIVTVSADLGSHGVEMDGRECPQLPNRVLFRRVAAEYNSADASIQVRQVAQSSPPPAASSLAVQRQEASIAHLYWRAFSASESLKGVFQDYMHRGEAQRRFQVSVYPIAGPWSQFPRQDVQYNGATEGQDATSKPKSKL